jgi:hypothetical protein
VQAVGVDLHYDRDRDRGKAHHCTWAVVSIVTLAMVLNSDPRHGSHECGSCLYIPDRKKPVPTPIACRPSPIDAVAILRRSCRGRNWQVCAVRQEGSRCNLWKSILWNTWATLQLPLNCYQYYITAINLIIEAAVLR